MIIYYNPDCSKCNEAFDLLKQNNCEFTIRNYLSHPPSVEELKELLDKLKCKPIDIVRKKESLYQQLYAYKQFNDQEWLNILSQHPVLIERPIVINNNKAIIGRPPQLVLNII
ncbi:MAG: arsenate reductase family protein [Sphingobacteriaceae bacterium]|nr:arsenate reductase family protein [Sphingobacteriaceae bacterium]MBK7818861.1 arsenate reductase family protein [Sphingobacteriaceae bacterium]